MKARDILINLGNMITNDIRRAEAERGNVNTGLLNRSFSPTVNGVKNPRMKITGYKYLNDVEEGVPPGKVKPGDPAYIKAVTLWAMQKLKLSRKEAIRMAYILSRKHNQEGIPLDKEKLHVIAETYAENEGKYDEFLNTAVENELARAFSKIKSEKITI